MIPFVGSVHAANAALPTVTVTVGSPLTGTVATPISFTLSNPGSNQFALTGFTLVVPSGWSVTALSCTSGAVFTVAVTSASSCQYSGGSINPGSSDSGGLGLTVTAPAPSGSNTYPYSGTFTSNAQDASSLAFYTGPTFALQVMSPTTAAPVVTVTPGGSNTAGSYSAGTAPYTITAVVTCTPGSGCPASGKEAGLSVTFSAPGYAPSTTFSFTPTTAATDATGTATTTFQPSNSAILPDSSGVMAAIGTSGLSTTSGAITTKAGAPSTMKFAAPFGASHYLPYWGTPSAGVGHWACVGPSLPCSTASGPITASIADKFGNPEDLSTLGPYAVTISAVAAGGIFDSGASHPTSVTCGTGLTCPVAPGSTVLTVTYPYFQSGTYGSKGLLTAGATSTGPTFAAAGSSGNLVTTTFDTVVNAPTINGAASPATCAAAVPIAANPCQLAGKTVNVIFNATVVQAGIPVTFYVSGASSAGYAGTFSNTKQAITVTTGANGGVAAVFSVDTAAGATGKFYDNFTRPTDANTGGTTTKSADSAATVTTIAGAASKMLVSVFFTNTGGILSNAVGASSVGGLTLWVNAAFSDAYGNKATNPGPNAVQVTLSSTGGVLSATTVYIPTGGSDTLSSFGPIAWTLPSGSGASFTLTASGVVSGTSVSGTKIIATVSANPTILITSPTATTGVVYSASTGVVFNGNANVSVGYPPTVHLASVTFSVDKGAAQSATIVTGAGTGKVTWSAGVFLTVGLHNITFTATDTNANAVTSATWKILVDTSAPTIKFTTATGATLTYGTSAKAVIFDTLGDLNTTSVAATYNGTAVASTNLVLTGTNTLGANSSFTVSVNNLPAGKWILTLTAKDLAGNANAGVSITVTVSVPFASSVVINSAAYATLGSFNGISVSATNIWSSGQNLVVFAVWKNGGGQTVAVTTGGLTLASGATGSTFCPLASGLPSGAYSVQVFVIDTSNHPVSSSTSISVTV